MKRLGVVVVVNSCYLIIQIINFSEVSISLRLIPSPADYCKRIMERSCAVERKVVCCGKCSASVQFASMSAPFHYTYQLDNLLEGFEL